MVFFRSVILAAFVLLFSKGITAQQLLQKVQTLFAEKNYSTIVTITSENKSSGLINDTALYYRAFAINELGEPDKALKIVQRLLKKMPRFAELYYLKGIINSSQENFGEAVVAFQKSFKLDSTNLKSLYNMALAKGMLGDYRGATKNLTDYLKQLPQSPEASYSRGYWYEMQENFEGAISDYNKTISLKPDMMEAYLSKAYVYFKTNQKDLACQTLQEAEQTGKQAVDEVKRLFCK
jgi:tetratricopeptide (TPR) repeat protein